ncbi:hypothetical protein PVMG_02395 [Plasmodium vivax Mauritania I]|uniref:rRNA-processing protein EBP2 n=1 Tax=Plasmodium vivax Mauritania I TaxID=1035515 RepID=A0A0J9TG68_PLAVI|nr:hypothetical protein PVMG_02395 [Plasmodium vivax Mauritania I]
MKALAVAVDRMGKKQEKLKKQKKQKKRVTKEKARQSTPGEELPVKKKKKNGTETMLKKKGSISAKDIAVRKIFKKLKRMGALEGEAVEKKPKKGATKLGKITQKGSSLRKDTTKGNLLRKVTRKTRPGTDPDDSAEAKRSAQNKALLAKKRKEIMIKVPPSEGNNEWLEKLDLTCSQNFYLKKMKLYGNCQVREGEFLRLTHENVVEGLKKLQDLHISFNRPYDFLADMMKSDLHMERVRQKIVKDHERVEEKEKNKIKRMNKKFNKKSGSAKVASQMEAIEKKKNLQKIDQLRKEDKLQTLDVQEFFLKHAKSDQEKKGRRGEKTQSGRKGNTKGDRKGNSHSDRKGNSHSDRRGNAQNDRTGKARFKTKKRIKKNKKNKGRKNFKRR